MILDRFRLDGRVALVTGAGRGIGAAIAEALAQAGATVVVAARTSLEIEAVAGELRNAGLAADAVVADVTDRASVERLVRTVTERYRRLDVLVNNAGGAPFVPLLRTSEAAFEAALRLNVTSAFLLTRLAAPWLLESPGASVLNISSAMGRAVARGLVAYGTAKAALDHFTRQAANELAPNVRVNALSLGSIETDALGVVVDDEELVSAMTARTPMRRLGTPQDVAAAALWLCSDASSWVTGAVVPIDGGASWSTLAIDLPDLGPDDR